ncbi:hypothetical protein EB796_016542 [Bugula neritina]|uniref:Uncharacterized protein n=1 Tax=Bugula neritina TaxID=10212 RepID=A0A7J7JGE7_BUGNE|nr:hypothetical protein EB796_016542 [Bugula neritina]
MSSKITSDRDSVTQTSSSDESSVISSVTKHTKSSKRLSSAGKTSVDHHSGSIVKRDTTTKNAADKESVGKGGITRRDSEVFNATELRLNALAGVVTGKQAADYEVGEVVFVNHEGVPWPARIEEPSYISEVVTRFEFAVFLYGLHIRKRVRLKDMFLYEQNLQAFGGKSSNRILNIALYEHMKAPIRYLMKSRSHTALERYLEGPALELEVTEGDELQSTGDSLDYNPFQSGTLVSYDTALGYFTIISSFLFMAYLTWWILIMPFLEPSYFSLLKDYFPNPSHSLIYPITGGTILACSIICYVYTQLGKRC